MVSPSFGEFTSVEVCGVSNPSKEEVEEDEDRKPLRLFCPDSIGDEWVCGREAVREWWSDSNALGPSPMKADVCEEGWWPVCLLINCRCRCSVF